MTSVSRRQHLQCRKATKHGKRVPKMLGGQKHHDHSRIQHQRGNSPPRKNAQLLGFLHALLSTVLAFAVTAFSLLFWHSKAYFEYEQ